MPQLPESVAEKAALAWMEGPGYAEIERVMQGTVGLYGDLQGIAGKTLQEIEGLELPALNAPTAEPRE